MFGVFVIASRLAPVPDASADAISGGILIPGLNMLRIFAIRSIGVSIVLRNQIGFIGFLFCLGDYVQKIRRIKKIYKEQNSKYKKEVCFMKSRKKKSLTKRPGIAPLSGGFMIMSIVGFLISAYLVYDADKTWGLSFCLIFTLMFVASLISMTYAPVSEYSYFRNK